MFLLKKILGTMLMPLPFAALLICLGLLPLWRKRQWLANGMIRVGLAVLVAASLGPVGNGLLRPLEDRYAALSDAQIAVKAPPYVAVLGGGYSPRDGLSFTAALSSESTVRLAEGVRLQRLVPGSKLILSGGSVFGLPPSAHGYAIGAQALGTPIASIIVLDKAVDTGAEIRELRALLGDAPVLLVTSASHMPRAMAYSARFGLRAIPAPTGHFAEPFEFSLLTWIPSGRQVRRTETALHEYLGLVALTLGIA